MRGVVLDLDSLQPRDLDLQPLRRQLDEWRLYARTSRAQLQEHMAGAGVVVTNKVVIDAQAIRDNPQLELICVAATGTNNVDLAAARAAGIPVCNARDYATASVVEHVFALLLTLTRQLDSYRRRVADGGWSESPDFCLFDAPVDELSGRTLGIVGYGVLGQAVARAAAAFSMNVQVAQRLHGAPVTGRVALDTLLETSDVVSLHCPLSERTRGLIGAPQLARMKRDAILINTARGGIVDERALVDALQKREIQAAAVDVLEQEPPPPDNPLLSFRSPRLVVTPHMAWASRPARQRLVQEVADNVAAFTRGEPRNVVN